MFRLINEMVGRTKEIDILLRMLHTNESEFVVVIGRRRVGKTYLIRNAYQEKITFELTGIQNGSLNEQLSNFNFALAQYFNVEMDSIQKPNNWINAFQVLIKNIETLKSKSKRVIFIDELPWLASARSDFLKGLSFLWNSWASKNNIVLVTCGSAASWMIERVILHKGGLHNRVTRQIFLQPFTLSETKDYLHSQKVVLSHYQIAQLYMIIGGIPYYLKLVPGSKSVPQIVSSLFFAKNAPLKNEFENLYAALFSHHERYIAIIKACYTKWKGVTHTELVRLSGLPSGGTLTKMIKELEASGFIQVSNPYGKNKKDSLIRLVDEFSIFHLKYMSNSKIINWQTVSSSQSFKSWLGFAFENLCLKHIEEIKNSIGISDVTTHQYTYMQPATKDEQGVQIDMIIDRNDEVMHICEAKFYNKPYVIDKAYSENLQRKIRAMKMKAPMSKTVTLVMITTFGLKENKYSGMAYKEVALDDFFG